MSNKLRDILKGKLTNNQLNLIPSSFDVVGNILIFSDFPKELIKKENIIGKEILKNYKHIKSIFKKTKKSALYFLTSFNAFFGPIPLIPPGL